MVAQVLDLTVRGGMPDFFVTVDTVPVPGAEELVAIVLFDGAKCPGVIALSATEDIDEIIRQAARMRVVILDFRSPGGARELN